MSGKWFYRMFGQDFGPVTFDELKVLAEFGTISSDDEVRLETSSDWLPVASVSALNSGGASSNPVASAVIEKEPPRSSSPVAGADDWYCKTHGQELGPMSVDELTEFVSDGHLGPDDEVKLGAAGKWRRIGSMPRLAAVLPYEESPPPTQQPVAPVAKDVERPSVTPPLPRGESQAPPPPTALEPRKNTASATPPVSAPIVPAAPPVDVALIRAEAAFEATEQAAMQLIGWAFSPNCNPQWWGFMNGVENGPVAFMEIFTWVVSGQIQPTDYVRNGPYGQYAAAGNLPGLFSAALMMKQAADGLQLAKTRAAQSAAPAQSNPAKPAGVAVAPIPVPPVATAPATPPPAAAPAPVAAIQPSPKVSAPPSSSVADSVRPPAPEVRSDTSKADAVTSVTPKTEALKSVTPVRPAPLPTPAASIPEPKPAANPNVSSGSFSGSMSSGTSSMARPVSPPFKPPKPVSRSSGSSVGESLMGLLTHPVTLGGIGLLAIVLVIVMGWKYAPAVTSGADIKGYEELKKLLADVREKRTAKSSDFSDIKERAKKMIKEEVPRLKPDASPSYPAKQQLLWAIRDELPPLMKADMTTETKEEKTLLDRIDVIAEKLKIK